MALKRRDKASTVTGSVLPVSLRATGATRGMFDPEFRLPVPTLNGRLCAMKNAIHMDASGRLVLPKIVRDRLNLRGGVRLRADVVAGHIELTPLGDSAEQVTRRKDGITVLTRTGTARDAAAAVAAEREAQADRGKGQAAPATALAW
jgi:bifunctional DNA-binding transcriptional regulator/antitoxin component of YhaV-PrlF toxin-antitoxin module